MKFELEKIRRNIPESELLDDLRAVAEKLKQNFVTASQQDQFGNFDSSTFKRRFGGWLKACKQAGLGAERQQQTARLSEEQLFQNLEEVWTKLGRQPRISEMFPPLSIYSAGTYKRHFGTWMRGLEKFVAFINNEESISSESAIKNLDIEPTTKHKTKRDINWRIRFIVMKRDNFKCKKCGRSPATDPRVILHVDHKRAWVNGGETVLENLETLCSKCNIGKSNLD